MADIAGRWLRVSTSGQDEESQIPDVDKWITSHEYANGPTYQLHGRSAHKGNKQFDTMWAKVLKDIRTGVIQVLVVWKLDRMDRKLEALNMIKAVSDAGGRVEFTTQPHLNDLSQMGNRIALTVQMEIAYQESKDKSDRIVAKQNAIRLNGGYIGRPIFGYVIAKRSDGYKALVPNDDTRAIVPQMFQLIADGMSLANVCRWLDASGIAPMAGKKWAPKSVSQYIRSTVYLGQCKNAAGDIIHECEPIVDSKLWIAANKRLDNAPVGRRGTVKLPPALLTGSVECGKCGAPSYRLKNFYRCHGFNPNPVSCGNSVHLDYLDAKVDGIMQWNTGEITERRWIEGNDTEIQAELANLEVAKRSIGNRGLEVSKMIEELNRIQADEESLTIALQTAKSGYWAEVSTGVTYAELWSQSDLAGKREMLKGLKVTYADGDVVVRKSDEPWFALER